MCDDTVGHTHSHHFDLILQPVLFQQFHHRRAESSGEISFLDRDDQAPGLCQRQDQFGIERLDEAGVDEGCFDALFS